jgi:ArsR family transcriptional regulator
MKELSTAFKALADPTRLRITNLLLRSTFCVCEMERILKLSQPLLSRHLAYLRNCGLVESRRDGMRVNYNLNEKHPLIKQIRPFLVDALASDALGRADLRTWTGPHKDQRNRAWTTLRTPQLTKSSATCGR